MPLSAAGFQAGFRPPSGKEAAIPRSSKRQGLKCTRRCDINGTPTRSAPAWSAESRSPRAPRVLLAVVVGQSALCLAHVGATGHLPVALVVLCATLLALQSAATWRRIGRRTRIAHDNGVWTISPLPDGSARCGTLLRAKYRSSWLLVLVFQTEDGKRFSEEIWSGAVSAQVFSQLHFAALYGARPAIDS